MQFTESLRKNYQFKFVYKNGKSFANRNLVLYVTKNNLECNRLGVSVSKKVGKSVIRSRITRLVKENYRLNEKKVHCGYDLVFIARNPIATANFYDVRNSVLNLLNRHTLLKSKGDRN